MASESRSTQRRDAAAFQFLAQAAGERDGDVFFEQRGAESFSVVVAAVAGVDYGEVAAGERGRRRGRDWSRLRRLRTDAAPGAVPGAGGAAFCVAFCAAAEAEVAEIDDRASVVAEAGDHRDRGIDRDDGCAVALAVDGRGDGFVAEGERGRGRRDHGFAGEGHAQRAGFGGDAWVHGRGEMEDEPRRIFGGER